MRYFEQTDKFLLTSHSNRYEEEILRLRRQIDAQSGNGITPSSFAGN
jgi:hypothetical protein